MDQYSKEYSVINDSRQQKFELELAREARGNEYALKFQEQINSGEGGKFTRATRRMLALILVSTLSAVVILCTLFPPQKSSPSQTLVEKVQQNSSLGSSLFQLSKPLYH